MAGALEALFRSYYDPLCAVAGRYVECSDGAEDVVQDVFTLLWERPSLWQGCKEPRRYLYVAVRNCALRHRAHDRVVQKVREALERLGDSVGNGAEPPVQSAQEAPQLTATNPELESRDQPVADEDLRILLKAAELLRNESVWNRNDDRVCDDDEATGKRSLFCALQKACIDVLGKYDHRRVALQEVRFAVEDATRGRDFEHRLMDFNNLPETRLTDANQVLRIATDRVRSRLKIKPQ